MIKQRRLTYSLLLSLLFHVLLLSLTFGDEEFGFPGLGFPWEERRAEAPRLNIVLAPLPQLTSTEPDAPLTTEPLQPPPVGQSDAATLIADPSATPTPRGLTIVRSASAAEAPAVKQDITPDAASPKEPARTKQIAAAPTIPPEPTKQPDVVKPPAPPEPTPVSTTVPSLSSVEPIATAPHDLGKAVQQQIVIQAPKPTVEQAASRQEPGHQEAVRQAAVEQEAQRQSVARQEASRVEAVRQEAERQATAQQAAAALEVQRQAEARQEAARVEVARQDAERQAAARLAAAEAEAQRQAAAEVEAQRQAAARQEAARVEAAQQDAERQAAARLAAAEAEAQRQATARQEAARAEAARQEAERQAAARAAATEAEAQRQAAARQEAARGETARQDTDRQAAARLAAAEVEARREERLRAIGRQLNEEASQRETTRQEAERQSKSLPLSLSTARRIRLFGRAHTNAELIQYAEAWSRKIQANTRVETARELAKLPHRSALVTAAIRSDGSVETVTFEVSSGVAEVDDAIRRIVKAQKPYAPFSPALAREYDVVEIRRTWVFKTTLQLQ